MTLHNCSLTLVNVAKQRLLFVSATLDYIVRRKTVFSKTSHKVVDLSPFIFETSLKPYVDISKINLLDKFFNTVNVNRSTYTFVIDEGVAKDIVEKISSKTNCKNSIIVEANPGLGLITLNLINSGASCIFACDSSPLQQLCLSNIVEKHSDKVSLKKHNIFRDSDSLILSIFDEAQKQNLNVSLLAVTTSFYFIRLLVIIFFKNNLWKTSCDVHLVVSSLLWNCLGNLNPKYLKFLHYCALNLLFKYEKIASYPCSAFLPVSESKDDFHLIRMLINPNLFLHLEENELIEYIVFVTILGSSSYNLVIPTLEKWLPNCGPYLISKGISMTIRALDLSYEESITLFNFFKKCDGYSNFKACVSHFFEDLAG